MINTDILHVPAYTTRDFRNLGVFEKDKFYNFNFSPSDNALRRTGAVCLFPKEMCNLVVKHDVVIGEKKYKEGESIDPSTLDDNTIGTFIKTKMIDCSLKEEFANNEEFAIKIAKLYEQVGLSFKDISQLFNLDTEILKKEFELKNISKKVKKEDIQKLSTLIGV